MLEDYCRSLAALSIVGALFLGRKVNITADGITAFGTASARERERGGGGERETFDTLMVYCCRQ